MTTGYRVLHAAEAFWRPSNATGVLNTDLAGQRVLTLEPLSALAVEPRTVRQVLDDTDAGALWLVCGAPAEPANTLEMSAETLADLYPDGPTALAPELADG